MNSPSREDAALHVKSTADRRLLILVIGIVALMAIGLAVLLALRPPATGLVIVDIPANLQGKVSVRINGVEVTETPGKPLATWPMVRTVKIGKTAVQLSAPGFSTATKIVSVGEGDAVQVHESLVPSAAAPSAQPAQ